MKKFTGNAVLIQFENKSLMQEFIRNFRYI